MSWIRTGVRVQSTLYAFVLVLLPALDLPLWPVQSQEGRERQLSARVKLPLTKAYPTAVLFPRPVLTAKKAGTQLASSGTFVLSPPAKPSLGHSIGYELLPGLHHLLPNPQWVASSMFRVDTDWFRAIILWTFFS